MTNNEPNVKLPELPPHFSANFSPEQMHAYARAAIALNTTGAQANWTKDAEEWGGALNEAAWEFVETFPEKTAMVFNHCKPALRAAILKYASMIDTHPAPTNVAAQEKVEATLRDVLAYVGNRTDGDLITLAGRAEHWMRGSKSLIDMQLDLLRSRRSKPAPTGAYEAGKVEALVKLAKDCADSLEAELNARYSGTLHYPSMKARYDADMRDVIDLRAALAALAEGDRDG